MPPIWVILMLRPWGRQKSFTDTLSLWNHCQIWAIEGFDFGFGLRIYVHRRGAKSAEVDFIGLVF
jgi:hypothetical protein